MKKYLWLIIAFSLILIGCIVFCGVMMALDWDFSKLATAKNETNKYTVSDDFQNISIVTDTADITFIPSEDTQCHVVCYEYEKAKHSATVVDGTLSIKISNTMAWYDYIGLQFGTPKITLYLPKAEYAALSINGSTGDIKIPEQFTFADTDIALSTGDVTFSAIAATAVKIKTSTGKICVNNTFAESLDLCASTGHITLSSVTCRKDVSCDVTTGDIQMDNLRCNNLFSDGDTGDLTLQNVFAAEKFSIVRSTGHIKFEKCDAAEIYAETDTGNVSGSLLSNKVFITEADTGRVIVPNSTSGGKCEIKTNTGDINITVN